MKRLIPLILCLMFLSCREETIPTVTVDIQAEELVGLSADTTFDTIPYQLTRILRDTFYVDSLLPDSLVIDSIQTDTLLIDTISIDTFFIDTIRLCGFVQYAGDKEYGPALIECGFCANGTITYTATLSYDQKTAAEDYGYFSYVLPVRNTDIFYVYAYAQNPFGIVRSQTREVRISNHDSR